MSEFNILEQSEEECFESLELAVNCSFGDFSLSKQEAYPRIQKELEYIKKNKWAKSFLIMEEVSKCIREITPNVYCDASGSLVAYILQITDINPIEHKLIFECQYPIGEDANINYNIKFYIEENFSKIKDKLTATFGEVTFHDFEDFDENKMCRTLIKKRLQNLFFYTSISSLQSIQKSSTENEKLYGRYIFTEDMFYLIHFLTGQSYEEIKKFYHAIQCDIICEIEQYKQVFMKSKQSNVSEPEWEKLFYEIVENFNKCTNKASYVFAKKILDEYYPF